MEGLILLLAALMSALRGVLSQQRSRAAQRLVVLFVAVLGVLVGTTAVASASSASRFQPWSRFTVGSAAETRVGVAATPIGTRVGPNRSVVAGQVGVSCPRFVQMVVGSCVATKPGAGALTESDAAVSGIVRDAAKGKGNFGLGSASAAEADAACRAWVGEGAKLASDGKTLVSADGLRQYRRPTYKPNLGITQANLESRTVAQGRWQSNGHIDVKP